MESAHQAGEVLTRIKSKGHAVEEPRRNLVSVAGSARGQAIER